MQNGRACLQEISINTIQLRTNKLKKKLAVDPSLPQRIPCMSKQKTEMMETGMAQKMKYMIETVLTGINTLPTELLTLIFCYLRSEEILGKVQVVSKKWHQLVQSQYLWKRLEDINPLIFEHKYVKQKRLVERRSKGKIYIATNRLTGDRCIVRKVLLDVTNAGHDDGIPTSVLREISYLSSLSHTNVGTVVEAQVKGNLLFLAYPHHKYNLKEYMKLFLESERSVLSTPLADKNCKYKMPLSKIKVK